MNGVGGVRVRTTTLKASMVLIPIFNPYFIEKNCDRGNESVLVQIRSPFDRLMTKVTMPNSKSQVQ